MSIHIFSNIVTPYGTASNNRGETDGNTTTLQKLVWKSQVHTTVSAEAIRFALRREFSGSGETTNRYWDDGLGENQWRDPNFDQGVSYIDDDLLGYMNAKAAASEGNEEEEEQKSQKKSKKKEDVKVRRAVLEVTRAVSLTSWSGDVSFNAASPGATPSAAKNQKDKTSKKQNPVPYGTELHATRYQYGLAMTPDRLKVKSRAATALRAISSLRCVAGNHGRFLYDFSPEIMILRITEDPAPRILYCFDTPDGGKTVSAEALFQRLESKDVLANELFVGVSDLHSPLAMELQQLGVTVSGVRNAVGAACEKITQAVDQK